MPVANKVSPEEVLRPDVQALNPLVRLKPEPLPDIQWFRRGCISDEGVLPFETRKELSPRFFILGAKLPVFQHLLEWGFVENYPRPLNIEGIF